MKLYHFVCIVILILAGAVQPIHAQSKVYERYCKTNLFFSPEHATSQASSATENSEKAESDSLNTDAEQIKPSPTEARNDESNNKKTEDKKVQNTDKTDSTYTFQDQQTRSKRILPLLSVIYKISMFFLSVMIYH